MPSTSAICILVLAVGWSASVANTFHKAYSVHAERSEQYRALAASSLCTDDHERIASEMVNRCHEAMRFAEQRTLSPFTLALLETLEGFALCGGEHNRCDTLLRALFDSWFKLCILIVVTACAASWLLMQKSKMEAVIAKELPLDAKQYPTRIPFYINKDA